MFKKSRLFADLSDQPTKVALDNVDIYSYMYLNIESLV